MYNDRVATNSYEIRICEACGLRYPLIEGHPFGIRCPSCMGQTRVVLRQAWNAHERTSAGTQSRQRGHRAVLLDNVRSAWNVGSILRSADGFGFTHAYLCGITPTADHESVIKTSLGAETSVHWSYHKDAVKLVQSLGVGWKVYALEETEGALPIRDITGFTDEAPSVLIVGNEVTGVDPQLLELCDQVFYIPMRGAKKSFNVAIAFGIAAYALDAQARTL